MTLPKSIEKFLVKFWNYNKEDLKEQLLEEDHYIVWYCGIDHIVDRNKTPDNVIIHTEFAQYNFDFSYKKSEHVVIRFNDEVQFFYYILSDFIEKYYEGKPFEMRVIQIPDGMYYLEFKLDEKYSFVFQQLMILTDEEKEEVEKFTYMKLTEQKEIELDKIFKSINISSDMIL